jgi:hypothetical protein
MAAVLVLVDHAGNHQSISKHIKPYQNQNDRTLSLMGG